MVVRDAGKKKELPLGSRPAEAHAFPVAIIACGAGDAGTAILFVSPNRQVAVTNASVPNQNEVILGDVQFRPGA